MFWLDSNRMWWEAVEGGWKDASISRGNSAPWSSSRCLLCPGRNVVEPLSFNSFPWSSIHLNTSSNPCIIIQCYFTTHSKTRVQAKRDFTLFFFVVSQQRNELHYLFVCLFIFVILNSREKYPVAAIIKVDCFISINDRVRFLVLKFCYSVLFVVSTVTSRSPELRPQSPSCSWQRRSVCCRKSWRRTADPKPKFSSRYSNACSSNLTANTSSWQGEAALFFLNLFFFFGCSCYVLDVH